MNNLKNIVLYIFFSTSFFCFSACEKTPLSDNFRQEPEFAFIVREKDGEKADFFTSNDSLYNKDSVDLIAPNSTFPLRKWWRRKSGSNNLFAVNNATSIFLYYIDYRNGDMDTLSKVVVADKDFPLINETKRLTWYFNGKEAKVFDFENTPGLSEELYTRNCMEKCLREGGNPIIIDLYK